MDFNGTMHYLCRPAERGPANVAHAFRGSDRRTSPTGDGGRTPAAARRTGTHDAGRPGPPVFQPPVPARVRYCTSMGEWSIGPCSRRQDHARLRRLGIRVNTAWRVLLVHDGDEGVASGGAAKGGLILHGPVPKVLYQSFASLASLSLHVASMPDANQRDHQGRRAEDGGMNPTMVVVVALSTLQGHLGVERVVVCSVLRFVVTHHAIRDGYGGSPFAHTAPP